MQVSNRRHDIDWLRVIAIGLLLIYHIAIGFQPWGVFIQFIQNGDSLESIWTPMSMLNVWRIPLLFFVSGMGVCFAIKKRTWKQLIQERSQRILMPYLFGIFTIVPIHVLLWQLYYHQAPIYSFFPGHLWFLGNIFIYVLVLSPIFFYLKSRPDGKLQKWLRYIFSHPFWLLLIVIPFIIEALLVNPESYALYAMSFHGFWLGMIAFLLGFCFVSTGNGFWNTVLKWRWMYLLIAAGLYGVRLVLYKLEGPNYLTSIESCFWILTVFGFGFKYLNKPSKSLSYLSQAAYPIYIIHMIFIYLGSYFLFTQPLSAMLKFVLLIAFTAIGCFVTYEFVIRRINIIRPLFGLKMKEKTDPKQNELATTTLVQQDQIL